MIDELAKYENEFRILRKRVFDATYGDIVKGLLEPINGLLEEEYEKLCP